MKLSELQTPGKVSIPAQFLESVRDHCERACAYWAPDEPALKGLDVTEHAFVGWVAVGVQRLLQRGGPLAARMVEDWLGDDEVIDAVIQYGVFGELRYG